MIVLRYLARELLQSWLAISGVLLLITISGRFIKYLQQAATGALNPDFLFPIMGYRIPGFMELILPLGFFLAILMAYGRLYVDSEMVILEACGMSRKRLLGYTFAAGAMVMLVVGSISLFITPWGSDKSWDIFNTQDTMTEFDRLTPGRFQSMERGKRVAYTETLTDERTVMNQVFIADLADNTDNQAVGSIQGEGERAGLTILLAESGRLYRDAETGLRYMLLNDGYRYDLVAGKPASRITQYDIYGVQMSNREIPDIVRESTLPTGELFGSDNPKWQLELQWRFSIPLLIPIIIFMALPLARVNPRQGRFLKLLPGVLLYLFYLSMLILVRGMVEDGEFPVNPGLWSVHLLFGAIALALYFGPELVEQVQIRKTAGSQAV